MLGKLLRSRWTLLLLALLITPAAFAGPGSPCHAERITYYDGSGNVVGVTEYICWQGSFYWGQQTPYYTYEYLGACCSRCVRGSCGIEP